MEGRNSEINSPSENLDFKQSYEKEIKEAITKRITREMRYMKRNIDSKDVKTRLIGLKKSRMTKKDAKQIVDKAVNSFLGIKNMDKDKYIKYVETLRPKNDDSNLTEQIAQVFKSAQKIWRNSPTNPMAYDPEDDNHNS